MQGLGGSSGLIAQRAHATQMSGIDSILFVVEPPASGQCVSLDKAVCVAHAFGAALELLICSVPPRPAEDDGRLACELEELARPLRARCRDVSTRLIIGESLHQSLAQYIRETRFDLVIKEAHPGRPFRRALGRSTDANLIRSCGTPLLLTHSRPWALKPRILACVDPGHPNDPQAVLDHCILQGAQAFSRRLGGTLLALHACGRQMAASLGGCSTMAALSHEPWESDPLARLACVGELAEEYHIGADQVHLPPGGARDAIVREALELQADLVVMGAISRKNPLAPFMGHIAERVLDRLRCDVLVVKVPDASRRQIDHRACSEGLSLNS